MPLSAACDGDASQKILSASDPPSNARFCCTSSMPEISADMRVQGCRHQAGCMFDRFYSYVPIGRTRDLGVGCWICCLLLCSRAWLPDLSAPAALPRRETSRLSGSIASELRWRQCSCLDVGWDVTAGS